MEKKNNEQHWEHPYLSFDDTFKIAEEIKKRGGVANSDKLAEALNRKKGGWLALQIASLRRWKLADGRGDFKLTDFFRRIISPRALNDDAKAREEIFLDIPLFKNIYEKYKQDGLPEDPYFSNSLKADYGLKGRNPSLVAAIVREFIEKYMPNFGSADHLIKDEKNIDKPMKKIDDPHQKSFDLRKAQLVGKFPINITPDSSIKSLDWDIENEEDWIVVESYIKSLKKKWQEKIKNNIQPKPLEENPGNPGGK